MSWDGGKKGGGGGDSTAGQNKEVQAWRLGWYEYRYGEHHLPTGPKSSVA